MLFMCCCALTLFDKASEIFFSMRENRPSVAHKHIFAANYNAWRNFILIHIFHRRLFGNNWKEVYFKAFVMCFILCIGFFCFYSIHILGLSAAYQAISPNDENMNLDGWYMQILSNLGILTPVIPGLVSVSYSNLILRETLVLFPIIVLVCTIFVNNIFITSRLLRWLAAKRRPFWKTGGAIMITTFGTFALELLLIILVLIAICLLSLFSGTGIVQEGKFDADRHRVGFGIGVEIGGFTNIGGRIWSAPIFTEADFEKANVIKSPIDIITKSYNGKTEKRIDYRGIGQSEESVATCIFPNLPESDCVKKVRSMLFAVGSSAPKGTITEFLTELISSFSPYVCSTRSRRTIASSFSEEWQKTMVGLAAVPIYILSGVYLVRLLFSTIVPVAFFVDYLIIQQARKLFDEHKIAQTHILRHFGYFSLIPIASAIWLISRLCALFC